VLEAPPIDRTPHALEVCTPSGGDPLVLIAIPLGPPTAAGFPLMLRHAGAESATVRRAPSETGDLKPKRETAHRLTASHVRALETIDPDAPPPAPSLIGRALAGGKLIIEERVGEGGAGTVYRALHRDLRIPVAVKVMNSSFERDVDYCRRFHAEALAASRLDHPNLTRVLDYGQEPDGLLYMAMEFLDGWSLRAILEAEGRLDLARAAGYLIQVCSGLTHAHARGIVHPSPRTS
jgi:serine/threonine-protein kinase